jgi:hypothetical protein
VSWTPEPGGVALQTRIQRFIFNPYFPSKKFLRRATTPAKLTACVFRDIKTMEELIYVTSGKA